MHHAFSVIGLTVLLSTLVFAQPMPQLPDTIPAAWLDPTNHPRLFVFPEGLESARQVARDTEWGKAYLGAQTKRCQPLIDKSDEALRALVPPPGSTFVYGLSMNLDPVNQQRLRWAGWDDPFRVIGTDGAVYPNEQWPDDGEGAVDPQTAKRYHLRANANGFVVAQLEQFVLPALADVYALTGSQRHAHVAAVLLDALAAVYPTNRRGPMDYPTSPGDMDRGGRLTRPYYQTARGLINYGHAIDLIAHSGAFNQDSAYTGGSIREHVIRNLLWDGGTYCLDYAQRGYQLHNGHADYMQGASVVGVLLGRREFCDVMIEGPLSLKAMLDINIDRNGFYYETSPSYANHARELYVNLSELLEAMRRLGWENVPSGYEHPAMRLFLSGPFNRQEVGGHVPLIGDAGPDRHVLNPAQRRPSKREAAGVQDSFLSSQIGAAWLCLVRAPASDREGAAQLLVDSYGDDQPPVPPTERWHIYHITPAIAADLAGRSPDPARINTASTFYGAKGLALLRGGEGEKRYGAQFFFGPLHNHAQREALTWTFFARGAEWSLDPGYYNKHFRMGWTTQTVSHQAVLVDGESHAWEGGTGRLLAWHDSPDVQWAMAEHHGAYIGGPRVNRFERFIGQVRDPASGDLGYWLDVSFVEGGTQRDDSFHTRMSKAELDIELSPTGQAAMFGDEDLGRAIDSELYLTGREDKGFYWVAPGAGYGFLGSPRVAPLNRNVRVVMTEPLWMTEKTVTIVTDLLGSAGRQLFVADGPEVGNAPAVPYLISRDTGEGSSTFAKVIRVVEGIDADPIASVEQQGTGTFIVTWKSGQVDRWTIGPQGVQLSRGEETIKPATPTMVGVVSAVSGDGEPATLTVRWTTALQPIRTGMPLITTPTLGQPTTWRIASVEGERIQLEDASLAMASTQLAPVADQAGWYSLRSGVSRFISAGNRPNTPYAIGKAVYHGKALVGRITDISSDGSRIKIEGPGVAARNNADFTARILEVGAGDKVTIIW